MARSVRRAHPGFARPALRIPSGSSRMREGSRRYWGVSFAGYAGQPERVAPLGLRLGLLVRGFGSGRVPLRGCALG